MACLEGNFCSFVFELPGAGYLWCSDKLTETNATDRSGRDHAQMLDVLHRETKTLKT